MKAKTTFWFNRHQIGFLMFGESTKLAKLQLRVHSDRLILCFAFQFLLFPKLIFVVKVAFQVFLFIYFNLKNRLFEKNVLVFFHSSSWNLWMAIAFPVEWNDQEILVIRRFRRRPFYSEIKSSAIPSERSCSGFWTG